MILECPAYLIHALNQEEIDNILDEVEIAFYNKEDAIFAKMVWG